MQGIHQFPSHPIPYYAHILQCACTTLHTYHTTSPPIPHYTSKTLLENHIKHLPHYLPPHTHHTLSNATVLPSATPISINSSPNLGLEPNPQTLTSGQTSDHLNISICKKTLGLLVKLDNACF